MGGQGTSEAGILVYNWKILKFQEIFLFFFFLVVEF